MTTRLIVLAVIVVAILALGIGYCSQRKRASELSDNLAKSDTRTGSAVKAIEEIEKLDQRGEVADKELEKAHDAIRQADPADRDAIARRELTCLQHGSACDRVQ